SDLRGRAPESEDRRDPRSLPGADLRDDQHRSLATRRAATAHVGDRGAQDQVRVTAPNRDAPLDPPSLSDELPARTLERFERHRRVWTQNRALRALNADLYARVAAELPAAAVGRRVELGSGPGFAREFIPGLELTDLVRAAWHDREVSAE